MRRAGAILAGTVALAWAPCVAANTPTVAQLPGSAGCVSGPGNSDPKAQSGCAPARLPIGAKLAGSPDGRHIYLTGNGNRIAGDVITLRRDQTTGALSQTGCAGSGSPCSEVRLNDARSSVVSPDGRNVYVAADGFGMSAVGGVVEFARDPLTGQLTKIGCKGNLDGCLLDDAALAGASAVTMPPDGRHVYVAAQGRLVTLARAPDGTLNRVGCIGSQEGCERSPDRSSCRSPLDPSCQASAGAFQGGGLAFSPDSKQLYMVGGRALPRVFTRDEATGSLTPLADPGCAALGVDLCGSRPQSSGLAVARDGRDVYSTLIAGYTLPGHRAIVRSKPLATTPVLAPWGCLGGSTPLPCSDAGVAKGNGALAMAPDDRAVYSAFTTFGLSPGDREAGIAVFSRGDSGKLDPASCVSNSGSGGRCVQGRALDYPTDVLVSPDGRNVYVTGSEPQIAVLGPSVALTASSVRFDQRGRSRVGLSCPAVAKSRCRGTIVLAAGTRRRTVARRGFSLGPGRRSRVEVRLNRTGLRALKRGRRAKGEARLGAGGRVSGRSIRQITLRRARSRR